MLKYMKYEIKGTYKFMLALIITVLAASTGIQLYAYRQVSRIYVSPKVAEPTGFLVMIFVLMIFGAFVTAFFYIVGSFRKELYEDRGYLTFSLPLTGNQLVGSKMIIALLWSAVIGLSTFIFNYLLGMVLFGTHWIKGFQLVFSMIPGNVTAFMSISLSLSGIFTLILIYFSMTLSRVSIRSRKLGGMWFIIFLILNALMGILIAKAISIFPYYINLTNLKILTHSDLAALIGNNTNYFMSPGSDKSLIMDIGKDLYVNIGSALFTIIAGIGTFISTSYLLERKIDL